MMIARLLIILGATTILTFSISGQTKSKIGKNSNGVIGGVTCETIIDSTDRALREADLRKSNVIVIVRSGPGTSHSLSVARAKGLQLYFIYRGFKDFEIGTDLLKGDPARVDMYVAGGRMFSLPIGSRDDLDLSPCVLGVEK